MTLRFLNCFTCSARVPSSWHTGTVCILVETTQGLVLIDTGPGSADYLRPPGILRVFQVITRVPMDADEAAVRQVATPTRDDEAFEVIMRPSSRLTKSPAHQRRNKAVASMIGPLVSPKPSKYSPPFARL